MKQTSLTHTTSWVVIGVTLATLLLYLVPFLQPIAYPFMLLSTLVHEMGHGFASLLVGGDFHSFQMWSDGSGVANISGNFGAFARAFIAGAGLVGPAVVAALFFMAVTSEQGARVALALFGIILVLSLVLVVRNLFGVFFVSIIAVLCYFFSLGGGKKYSKIALSFLALQLSLSVFSRSDYLFTDKAITSAGVMPSDVAQMADALLLPYWFWGIVCGLFSLAILAFGVRQVFK